MEFKAVIIDDEANLREVISIKVGKLDKDVKIVGQASNAEDGYNLIKAINPDIVFLDITMPNDLSRISLQNPPFRIFSSFRAHFHWA